MPSRLPLLRRCCLDGQSSEWGCEHLNAYLSRPRRPRCWLLEPLGSLLLRKWNLSIFSSSDRREEEISSSGTVAILGRTRWSGSTTGGRLSWARKFGCDMSICASRWSPALMVWPISWYISEILSPKLSELLSTAYLHLQRSRTSTSS